MINGLPRYYIMIFQNRRNEFYEKQVKLIFGFEWFARVKQKSLFFLAFLRDRYY